MNDDIGKSLGSLERGLDDLKVEVHDIKQRLISLEATANLGKGALGATLKIGAILSGVAGLWLAFYHFIIKSVGH